MKKINVKSIETVVKEDKIYKGYFKILCEVNGVTFESNTVHKKDELIRLGFLDGLKKRFFTVQDQDSKEIIATITHNGDNSEFEKMLMLALSEHFGSKDIALDYGFLIENYHGKTVENAATMYHDDGDFKIDLNINETSVY